MEKRYQVFISSTFLDLKEERQAVIQALLSLDHFPAGMELFAASDDEAWALIQSVIDDSDYYIIVVAGRYGALSEDGISYTEKEFDYAREMKKPILAFLHETPGEIASSKTDENDTLRAQLTAFRKKIEKGRHVKYWTNADDLKAKVIQSIAVETKRNPQTGWVKANQIISPARLEELRQKNEELKQEIIQISSSAPKGTDDYQGGQDYFEFRLLYRKDYHENWQVHRISLEWDDIFSEIGPLLFDEASEDKLKSRLNSELQLYDAEFLASNPGNIVEIHGDDFETIKIQLFALGLTKKSAKKRAIQDRKTYWSLTEYGENYLLKLRALRKG